MSNTVTEALNMTVSSDDLFHIYSTVLWLGAAAPNYANITTGKLLGLVTEQYMSNPNISVQELASFLGSSETTTLRFMEYLGGIENTPYILSYADTLMPYVPHPMNTTMVIPLFLFFSFICTIVIGLRLVSRKKVAGSIQSSDWMMVLGYLLTFVWGSLAVYHSLLAGRFAAFYDVTYDNNISQEKYYFILMLIYPLAMFAIKSSLLLFYYHMSSNMKYLQYAAIATFVVLSGNTIAAFFAWLFQCNQVDFWNNVFFVKYDVNVYTLAIVTSAFNIATDLMIWAMPMPLVWRLQLYPRERVLAAVTFSLGGVACIASCFRLVSVKEHIRYSGTSSSTLMIDAWTIIELNLAIICASAPALRALFVHYAPKLLDISSLKNNPSNSSRSDTGRRTPQPRFETVFEKSIETDFDAKEMV